MGHYSRIYYWNLLLAYTNTDETLSFDWEEIRSGLKLTQSPQSQGQTRNRTISSAVGSY